MTEGTVVRWLKQPGDTVTRGEPIVEIETDKATITYEADLDGVLSEILVGEGMTVPVGAQIARIAGAGDVPTAGVPDAGAVAAEAQPTPPPGETAAATAPPAQPPAAGQVPAPPGQPTPPPEPEPVFEVPGHGDDGGRVKASPIARRLARKLGVDLAAVTGSGPAGRIVKEDVEAAASAAAAAASAPSAVTQAPAEPPPAQEWQPPQPSPTESGPLPTETGPQETMPATEYQAAAPGLAEPSPQPPAGPGPLPAETPSFEQPPAEGAIPGEYDRFGESGEHPVFTDTGHGRQTPAPLPTDLGGAATPAAFDQQPAPAATPPIQPPQPPQPQPQPLPGPAPFVPGMTGGFPAIQSQPPGMPAPGVQPPGMPLPGAAPGALSPGLQPPLQPGLTPPGMTPPGMTPPGLAPPGMITPEPSPLATATRGQAISLEPTGPQQTVARRMAESKATAPDFFVEVDVDMTSAVNFREHLKLAVQPTPSFNDMVVKACALALRQYPKVNGAYKDGHFEQYGDVNVGIVVAAGELLAVPTLFNADQKGLAQIARESTELANAVRARAIQPAQLAGGTFSVSNLGMYGVERFTAILNPPQAAILAVGAIKRKPVIAEDGVSLAVRQIMALTLTCDHRILYGAEGAEFLAAVKSWLESPQSLPI